MCGGPRFRSGKTSYDACPSGARITQMRYARGGELFAENDFQKDAARIVIGDYRRAVLRLPNR
jgi:hypothetical protein